MKTSILPAIVIGAASLVLSSSVIAGTNTSQPVEPVAGLFHATGSALSGVGHAAVGVVGGVVGGVAHGTAYVLRGVTHTSTKVMSGHEMTTKHQVKHVNY